MKRLNSLLLFVFALLFVQLGYSQRAKDGNLTVSTANNIVNTYADVTADANAGATSITVNNNAMTGGVFGGSLAPGDLILIIQMQGTAPDMHPYPTTVWGGDYTAPVNYVFTGDWWEHKEAFGAIIDYYNTGNFEKVEVLSVSGTNTINLQCALTKNYTASGHVQVVRIPRFDNLTVTGGPDAIIPVQWNGETGGVVAIEVDQVLDIQAGSSISASGDGFRGGQVDPIGQTGNPLTVTGAGAVTFVGTSDPADGSEKGESIAGFYTEYDALYSRYGTGACTNGGGGGGFQNAGGGGGSNISLSAVPFTGNGVPNPAYAAFWALDMTHPPFPSPPGSGPVVYTSIAGTSTPGGGRGGYALADVTPPYPNPATTGPNNSAWNGDGRKTNGGLGGFPLTYNPAKIFCGGGGGAGDQDSGQGGSGGRGGGIVFVTNYGSITGSGTIEANGAAGQNSNPLGQSASFGNKKGNDAAGGGGGGGSIYIENATPLPVSLNLNAIGGDGGDQNTLCGFSGAPFNLWDPDEASGPGGSGAGGSIAFNSGTPTQNVSAGVNGIHTSNHPTPMISTFPPNGATNGSSGVSGLSAPYFDLVGVDDTICAGSSTTLTVTVLGSAPGTINWYTQQFGGASVGSGTSYNTPVLATTTTYWVGACPSTFRIPITVVVVSGATLVITDPAAVCAPATVDLTVAGVTVGSDPGTLTYWMDAGATLPLATPSAVATTGTYYIQLDIGGGCTAIEPVNVVVNPLEDPSFTYTPNCFGGTATITGDLGGSFAFNPAPGDGALVNGTTGEITNGTLGTTYFVQYTTGGPCPASLTQSVTAATTLAYTATITDENCGAGDGIIDLLASGGSGGPYQYSITGGAPYSGSGTFGSLSAASYNISILDNSGCEITGTELVNGTGGPTINSITPTAPTCANSCDGSITVSVSGGTPPYDYQWYDNLSNPIGTNSATITGLCAGDYSVEVTDASGGVVVLYSEDFESGLGGWTLNVPTGANGATPNVWQVNDQEGGVAPPGCGVGLNGDETMHITCTSLFCGSLITGALYNATQTSNYRTESPVFSTVGSTGLTLTFDFIGNGDGLLDNASLWYNAGSGWTLLDPSLKSIVCGGGQGQWTAYSVALPAICDNNATVQIGFNWTNNGDNIGTDPSIAINNVEVSSSSAACPAIANATLVAPPPVNLVITDPAAVCAPGTVDLTAASVTAGSDPGTFTYWSDAGATIAVGTPSAVATAGTYYIVLDDGTCTDTAAVIVTIDPQPVLTITDPAAVCAPATVDLTAAGVTAGSDPGTLTYWTDAAATIALASPSTVSTTGTYYIVLDNGTCSDTASVNVVVNPQPTLAITDPTAICAPGTVDITAGAVTAGSDPGTLTYWTDAAATSGLGTPSAVATSGTYYIVLNDGTCTDTAAVNVVINPQPTLIITDPPAVCAPGTVDITAASVTAGSSAGVLSYWADPAATIGIPTPNAIPISGTAYIVLNDGTCSDTASVTIVINPQPTLIITDPAAVCAPGTVDLTAAGVTAGSDPGTFTYWTDAGATSSLGTPSAVATSGTYYIVLNDGTCTDTGAVNVTINPQPVLSITDPAGVCAPGTVDLTAAGVTAGSDPGTLTYWTDAGATSSLGTPSAVATSGTYYIVLDDGTCTDTASVVVAISSQPTLIITDPAAVCAPGTVDLTAASITAGSDPGTLTYWTNAAATISLGTPTAVTTSGTYYIVLDNGGCTDTASVNVTINPQPTLTITDPAAVCSPGTVDLTAAAVTAGSSAGTFTYWTDAAATAALATPAAVSTGGTYYIVLNDGTCTDTAAVNVAINAQPTLTITDPAAVCAPGTVDLTAGAVTAGSSAGTFTYWTDAGATSSLGTPSAVGTTGMYYIVLNDGTCTDTAAVNVAINAQPTLTITNPSAVCSPNTVDLTAAAVTAGSSAGTLTYWTDAAATSSLASPNAVGTSGTYYIVLDDGTCTDTAAVNVVITSAPNLVITDPAAVCSPGTVDLTAAAVTAGSDPGILTYWTDAGATMALASPTSVSTTGIYYIQLDLGGGCTVVQPVNVTVNAQPTLSITDPAAVCALGSVDLTAAGVTAGSSAGTFTYWTDAAASSSLATPTAVNTGGTYYIVLDDGTCTDTAAVNVTINPQPTLSITDPAAVCAPGTVDLTAASVTAGSSAGTFTYWTDVAATVSLGTPGAVSTAGTYYIVLSDGTCTDTASVNVSINPQPTLTITDPAAACSPGTVDVTAASITAGSSAGTYTYWTDATASTTLATPSAVGTTGTYYIVLDDGTCTDTAAVNVTINAQPTLTITDPAAACAPATVDLTAAAVTTGSSAGTFTYWTDAAATMSLATPNAVATSGTYYIVLDDGTCTDTAAVNVTVTSSPNLVITDPAAVCEPGTVDVTDPAVTVGSDIGTLTYWTDAGATTTLTSPTTVGTTGTYYIQLDIGGGCIVVEPVNVTINPQPTLVITDPAAVCEPGTVDLTQASVTTGSDPGTLTYWTDAGATTSMPSPNAAASGTYYIQLTDANTCTTVGAVNAVVNPLDDASFVLSPTCDGATAQVSGLAGGAFTFASAPTAGSIDPTTGLITGGSSGTVYSVTYTTNGQCPNSSTESVTVDDCEIVDLVIPTAFTPEGDGVNDGWEILNLDNLYPNNVVMVYNRWGNLIFEHSSSPAYPYNGNKWDGTYKGSKLPVGSYYYIIDPNDGSEKFSGAVSIILN